MNARLATSTAAAGLLSVHGLLLASSLCRNSVTIDEYMHVPVGISYWDHGQFWSYHHNPPLIRLLAAIPAVVQDVPRDYCDYFYAPHSRESDWNLGRNFMLANRHQYQDVFVRSRAVVALLSVLGGYLVFRWSRELFGEVGGLVSLSLWTFCPNVLAHAGIVTPDLGATVFGFWATYAFWRYLQAPSIQEAILSGILLGLAEATKFSLIVLPLTWLIAAAVKIGCGRRTDPQPGRLALRRGMLHALLVTAVSLLVLNEVYLFEGTGRALGSFDFQSYTLTVESPAGADAGARGPRRNRFEDSLLGQVPVPLPEHYVLGFDEQLFDVDRKGYHKYLRGVLRGPTEPGWWYYYLYCLLVKTPVATLAIVVAAAMAMAHRNRLDIATEIMLALPALAVLTSISAQTSLNSHLRYVLPILPFTFVFAGRVGRAATGPVGRMLLVALLAMNIASVLRSHPRYLSYFNELSGGPRNGWRHLADSNIDWGEGLIALREWLHERGTEDRLHLAYFGFVDPQVYGLSYELPRFGAPVPGLHAVSVNYLVGIPFTSPDGTGRRIVVTEGAYTYFRRLRPVDCVGGSILIFRISDDEADRLQAEQRAPSSRD